MLKFGGTISHNVYTESTGSTHVIVQGSSQQLSMMCCGFLIPELSMELCWLSLHTRWPG